MTEIAKFFGGCIALAMLPQSAFACACCAERGERFLYKSELGHWELSEMAAVRAASPAQLFVSACDLECVSGISNPLYEYGVEVAVSEAGVDFDLSDEAGRFRGTLSFDLPAEYTYFGVDPEPGKSEGEPLLFTEIRFKGDVYGSGDFAGTKAVEAELIYSGFGNMCIGPGNFANWSLNVVGDGNEYRLFGALE